MQVKDGKLVEPKIHVTKLKPGTKTDVLVAKAMGEIPVVRRGKCYVKHPRYKGDEIVGTNYVLYQPSTNGTHALDTFMHFSRFGDAEMWTSECGTRRIAVNEGLGEQRNLAVIEQDGMFHFCNPQIMVCLAAVNACRETKRLDKLDWDALPQEEKERRNKERAQSLRRFKKAFKQKDKKKRIEMIGKIVHDRFNKGKTQDAE